MLTIISNITAFPSDGQKQRICASFHFKDGRSTFLLRVCIWRRICHHIKCSESRLTVLMNSRTELISVSYQQQPHVNSKGYLCSKVLKCIIYALVDLIETENVMFHSSSLLISRQSPTNVVALLQAPSAPGLGWSDR